MSASRKITVVGGNLFRLAAEQLGDATQWNRIAAINGLVDPFLQGLTTLTLPAPDASAGNGGILVEF